MGEWVQIRELGKTHDVVLTGPLTKSVDDDLDRWFSLDDANCRGRYSTSAIMTGSDYGMDFGFYFEDARDAVEFKLRFG